MVTKTVHLLIRAFIIGVLVNLALHQVAGGPPVSSAEHAPTYIEIEMSGDR
jgi:hypothetical protein